LVCAAEPTRLTGDDALRVEALEHGAALAADDVEEHRLALRHQLVGLPARGADDVGVERSGEAAVAGRDDDQVRVVLARADKQLRALRTRRDLGCERGHDLGHARRIGPRRSRVLLGTAQLRRRHHVQRLGDLLRRLDRADAELEGLE